MTTDARSSSKRFSPGLGLLLLWVAGASLWNLIGVVRIAHGLRAPGPTASVLAAVAILAIGIALFYFSTRSRWLYVSLSVLAGLAALAAVVTAFTSDPLLWPSDLSRYAGVAINCIGVLGAALAVLSKSLREK